MKIEDVMTREVRTVAPECSLKDVAALLAEHGIGGVPVIDEQDNPLGVVTKADIVIKERAEIPESKGRGLRSMFGHSEPNSVAMKVGARTAGEAMSAPPITVSADLPTSLAAEKMLSEGVNRLLVVRRGSLVGILTRHDLVRAFACSDAELEKEIRAEAVSSLSWPDGLELGLHDGEVTLRGEVDSVFDAEVLPRMVRHVLGVVSVDSELRGWDPATKKRVAIIAQL